MLWGYNRCQALCWESGDIKLRHRQVWNCEWICRQNSISFIVFDSVIPPWEIHLPVMPQWRVESHSKGNHSLNMSWSGCTKINSQPRECCVYCERPMLLTSIELHFMPLCSHWRPDAINMYSQVSTVKSSWWPPRRCPSRQVGLVSLNMKTPCRAQHYRVFSSERTKWTSRCIFGLENGGNLWTVSLIGGQNQRHLPWESTWAVKMDWLMARISIAVRCTDTPLKAVRWTDIE